MFTQPIQTERLTIQRYREEDVDALLPFFRKREIMYYYLPGELQTYDRQTLAELLRDWDDGESCFLFVIRYQNQTIGLFNLEDFSLTCSHTECGIALTSERYYGQGFAQEVVRAMLRLLFVNCELHRVYIRYLSGNDASKRLFERLGFRHEGCLREQVKRDDDYLDMHLMGLLRQEFLGQNLGEQPAQEPRK